MLKIDSIRLKEKEECYLCGRWDYLDRHHVFEGANRDASERYGLVVKICRPCHNMVHSSKGKDARDALHKEFQEIFELDHTREEFIKEFTCGSFL